MRSRLSPLLGLLLVMGMVTAAPGASRRKMRQGGRSHLQRAAVVQEEAKDAAAGSTMGETVTSSAGPAREGSTDGSPAPVATFEELIGKAEPLPDLQTLLIPPTGGCDELTGSIERARCEGTRAVLRRTLPDRWFSTLGDDPQVLLVSPYDAELKGYRLSVAGCLACAAPLTAGLPPGDRCVTLKTPGAGPTLRDAVELNRSTVTFESQNEAERWWVEAEGNLKVQFVFQASASEWTHATGKGYAFKLLGFRVFNQCTREILVSHPPSTGNVELAVPPSCLEQRRVARGKAAAAEPELKSGLSSDDLTSAMAAIRPQVAACYEKYKVPGRALLEYVVAGNGSVQSLRLSGIFAGTPTGTCVTEAARGARFPRFSTARQRFEYPFFLRAE